MAETVFVPDTGSDTPNPIDIVTSEPGPVIKAGQRAVAIGAVLTGRE